MSDVLGRDQPNQSLRPIDRIYYQDKLEDTTYDQNTQTQASLWTRPRLDIDFRSHDNGYTIASHSLYLDDDDGDGVPTSILLTTRRLVCILIVCQQ